MEQEARTEPYGEKMEYDPEVFRRYEYYKLEPNFKIKNELISETIEVKSINFNTEISEEKSLNSPILDLPLSKELLINYPKEVKKLLPDYGKEPKKYKKYNLIGNSAVSSVFENANKFLGPEMKGRRTIKDRLAHSFRSARMRLGKFGEITRALQSKPDLKSGVSAMLKRGKTLLDNTQGRTELHRSYAPLIAGFMSEPQTRTEFMDGIDEASRQESDSLKAEAIIAPIETDVLVVGAGVQGAIFTANLRAENPETRILTIDTSDKLGGQFRSYGERPVFKINSRNHRPQDSNERGLPGENGNLNSFSAKAPVQTTDFSTETYPTNIELGDTAAINQFLSSQTMLGVKLGQVTQTDDGEYLAVATDKQTGEQYTIKTKKIVVATGLGERKSIIEREIEGVWTAEDVFRHFGDKANLFPMEIFKGKNIAIIGAGDSGRVIAELLTRLGPKEAYGKSSTQLGGPEKIYWYGTEFRNKSEFQNLNRPRYQQLAPFIEERVAVNTGGTTIYPVRQKVTDISQSTFGRIIISTGSISNNGYAVDIVIDATQLINESLDPFIDIPGQLKEVTGYVPELGRTSIARALNDDICFVGPVARLPLTTEEQATFAEGIKENTAAIWANQLRTSAMAKITANTLK